MQQSIMSSSVACCLSHMAALCRTKRSPATEDQIAIERAKAAARKRKSHANKNPDQTAARRASSAENMQRLRDSQTPEQA